MKIYFSETLKQLRREKNMTQEVLANFLGVSFQAVSKWERGENYPDIATLPVIASFFGVTTDMLLGVDKIEQEEKIKQYIDEYYCLWQNGEIEKAKALMKSASEEYPGDYSLLVRYFNSLKSEVHTDEHLLGIRNEMQSIYDNIQNYCTQDSIRIWAKKLMCHYLRDLSIINNSGVDMSDVEKILDEMPVMQNSRDYDSIFLYLEGEKRTAVCQNAISEILWLMCEAVLRQYDNPVHYDPEVIESMLKLFKVLMPDEDYGKNYPHVVYYYGYLGVIYHIGNDFDKMLNCFENCARLARKYDELPQISTHTSPLLKGMVFDKTKVSGLTGTTMCKRVLHLMLNRYPLSEEFKNSKEFIEIMEILDL